MSADRDGAAHWPALQPEESMQEWAALRAWVDQLVERFPLSARVIPACWFRHNNLVEALSALRDYERACFHPRASPAGAFDFIRTVRDAEQLLSDWTSRLGCGAGEHREPLASGPLVDDGWQDFIAADHGHREAIADRVDAVLDYQ